MTQGALADAADTSSAYMSQIESGGTKLPNAGLRRRLARALGVSHLDLLIAAGELTETEVAYAGATGVIEEMEDSPASRICDLARQVRWIGDREEWIAQNLEAFVRKDQGGRS